MERLSARVSERARHGWDLAAARVGCTHTALIEALGLALDDRSWEVPPEVAQRAQQIDRERFSRRS